MKRLGRRDFLAWLAAGSAFRPGRLFAVEDVPVAFQKADPCPDLRPLVDAANDGFELERRGVEVERILAALLPNGGLPLSSGLAGRSPMPERYEWDGPVGEARYGGGPEAFAEGMSRWFRALGTVRRSEFRALPDDVVRFEVASETASGLEHRVGHWRMEWEGGRLSAFEPLDETVVRSPAPLFADATAEVIGDVPSVREQLAKGVPYWRSRLDSATGVGVYGNQGIAVGDVDGDGWDELYVCQPGGLPNRLYSRRREGAWEDITAEAGVGVRDNTSQALFLDLRNSGFQDLVVLASGGPLLFLNDGKGRFRHRPGAFRFKTQAKGTFAGMAAADFDRDGKLDLYLCSYLYFQSEDQYRYPAPYHDARNGPPNFLFRNNLGDDGEGLFEDATEEFGFDENNDRYSFAAAWCDYDEDGWPELYVANDFGRNNLYKYEGGRFRDIAEREGLHDVGPGMSAAWFDYNRDGRMDLYVTNMWTAAGQRVTRERSFGPLMAGAPQDDYRGHTMGNSLYRNVGDGSFRAAGSREGVGMGRWSWSGDGFDFDLDGVPEILVTAGMITHSPNKDLGSFFWRQVVANSPAEAKPVPAYEDGWNCLNQLVREDYSWNGGEPNVFYVRKAGRFRDFSGVSGLDRALDSRAFAVTDFDGDGRPDLFLKSRLGPQLMAFRNESAAGRKAIVIELEGTRSNRDAIGAIVRVETEDGVSAQSLSAGSGYISQHTKRLHFGIGDRARCRQVTVLWPSGERQMFDGFEAGYRYGIREGDSRFERTRIEPVPATKTGARQIVADNSLALEATWLMDPIPLPQPAEPGLLMLTDGARTDVPADVPHTVLDLSAASADRIASFAIFRRYLFDFRADLRLPMAYLVGDRSLVHRVYPGVPTAAAVRRDLETVRLWNMSPRAGLPFEGRYYGLPRRNQFQMGSAFLQAGYSELALPYLRAAAREGIDNAKAWLAVGQIELQRGNLEQAERDLEMARSLDPGSPQLWNNLGGLSMAQEDFHVALERFQRALDINEDLPYALVNAAQAHSRLGNAIEAERLLRRALEVDPSDAEAANKLGLIWAKQGRLDEARSLFEQAIENQRDHAEAINNLAVLYLQSKQVRDAMAAFRYGIEQVPDFDSFYMNLARVHADLGDYASAREVLRNLLEREPEHQAARRALVQLQRR